MRRWLDESKDVAPDPSAERLAGVLEDPDGLAFTVGFVDGVARPEDLAVAAKNLQALGSRVPAFLPWYLRSAVAAGGVFGEVVPGVVVPAARKVLRQMVGHLVIDATPAKLGPAIGKLRADGSRLNLNLLGEAVLGSAEARRRLEGTEKLLARDDVDYVSVKVSAVASDLSMWAFDETVERVAETLLPLYRIALPSNKFINLDMEEYRDLDLTLAVFMKILDREELLGYSGGIVLQAYLPDALGAMQRLQEWAAARRSRGGAPIKVRVVKGANLAMEHVDAALHGWPLATFDSKRETDTNYKRVLEWALTPERTDAVRIGVAGHNLFDIALAWLLAKHRGVTDSIDFEMLLGMATGQADAVRREVGALLLYTPVVQPKEFDVAISYLVRRLEENASDENFMSSVFDIAASDTVFEREKNRFLASVDAWESEPFPSTGSGIGTGSGNGSAAKRTQDRGDLSELARASDFENTADTDPSLAANRSWGRRILSLVGPGNRIGVETIDAAKVTDPGVLDRIIHSVREAGARWGAQTGAERAAVLRRAALALEANRDRLIEVMASETGKTIAEGDPEVSEAVDFANYYAARAEELDTVDGAVFVPSALTVVTPPWNFPVAIPAGGVLAALAAGSGVVIKPAPQARRSAAVLVEALWESGIPRELLALVDIEEGDLGRGLISHELVDRVILTGAYETAKLFRSWRPELPLLAETSGKNAIVVTPAADLDLAVADIVKSAFGHAGQKCSAASLVILVGSAARSERFHRQLVDAVSSLRVGYASDPLTEMGPLIEPAEGKLLEGLTTLGPGEKWLVEPVRRSSDGRLWTPGVREGVLPASPFHTTEYFGPVLGIMHASTLEQAVEYQNGTDYGLTAGLHSLDPAEVEQWLATVEAGNLYVNRGITGAIVQRQPFGGWKRSAVGAGAKAGGPNYLVHLGSWVTEPGEPSEGLSNAGLDGRVGALLDSAQAGLDWSSFDLARRGAKSDAVAWSQSFAPVDRSGLGVERNVLRYRPVPVTVRLSDDGERHELLRVLSAATLARSKVTLSSAHKLPRPMRALLKEWAVRVVIENDEAWLARVTAEGVSTPRIRLIGGSAERLASALGDEPDVAVYAGEVTRAGRIELLPFLREQAVSITNHRFGNPSTLSDGLL
ncbi:bifunctional proline dehydrogenase/L-glutamate gamma-semialdehyde dehydrogenase [Agreia sp. PsM10]|nr:bifunctional proline dehydrogenase/L-glutamate gamma-semialdehyde dehydrogenase [Agreia sp. PsM10]MDN4639889.1 bifunctional proline dehydrogenase/L-glutamate gamma-semialdehyde dehydrogenase [Agreia sp. PsM10]